MTAISEWIYGKTDREWKIYIKRLSANDTGLTGGKQVGVYIPKGVMSSIFPSINRTDLENPDHYFRARMVSHGLPEQTLRATYYNGKFHGKTRNEKRITRWNTDVDGSPLQDPESTGALAIFAFHAPESEIDCDYLEAWICQGVEEEVTVENQLGEVVPGQWIFDRGDLVFGGFALETVSRDSDVRFPAEWKLRFPTGREIIDYLAEAFTHRQNSPDELMIERRKLEYQLFRQLEEFHVLGRIKEGFGSVDDFMQLANSVSNRRKSRSGRSLEIHLEHLFKQFGLECFGTQCKTEGNKRPDFLFPSCSHYHDGSFPNERLRMLAVKTTCKDRWRQVLNEADRVENIHLFTLQEGVSPRQFEEMQSENVTLVVPAPLHKRYPKSFQDSLVSLAGFIEQTKALYR